MIDHIDPLDAYRKTRRAQALTNPRPLRRTGRRWLPANLSQYAIIEADRRGRLSIDTHGVDVASLAALIALSVSSGTPAGLLFADRNSLAGARKHLRRHAAGSDEAARDAGQALRALAVADTLPVNVVTPVLTDLMAANLWLPVDVPEQLSALDQTTDHPWQDALARWGLYDPAAGPMLPQLLDPSGMMPALMDGDPRANDATAQRVLGAVTSAARAAAGFGRYTSDKAAMAAFKSATQATDQGNFLLAIDPVAIDESLLAGQIAQLDVLSQDHREIVAAITDGVVRGSEKSDLHLFTHGFAMKAVLQGFEPDGDLMVAKLTRSTKSEAGLCPDRVYAVTAPFHMVPATPGDRWLKRSATQRAAKQREVPLPVILAGAPD